MSQISHRTAAPLAPRGWSHSLALFVTFICVVLFAIASFAQHAARADSSGLVRMADVESGALLLNSTEPGKYVPAPLLATDVKIDVTGPIARTRVTQHFINPGDGWVEGKYIFPLPENSAVDTLKMVIGDRVIEGKIKEKEEARRVYEEAKAQGHKASLVEQQRPNVFTNSVANIGPGETIIVQIEYQQTVRRDGDRFSLRFPMVVAPRYTPKTADPQLVDFAPGGGWGEVRQSEPENDLEQPPVLHPAQGQINPVSLALSLDAGFALGDISSTHHKIALNRDGKQKATLKLAEELTPANKDFELVWKPAAAKAPAAALFRERVGNEDYLLVMLTPPSGSVQPEAKPREAIFVIDNSGSMSGPSMVQAKESLLWALDRLKPGDTFNVIRFDDTLTVLFPDAVPAHGENLAVAKKFVKSLEANGGTEMLPALRASLIDRNVNDGTRLRQIVFLTDGAISNEAELFHEITSNLGRSRLFTVGIGSAPNSYFMTRASEAGRGTFTHIGKETEVTERMAELFEKLQNPVMTNITATWPDGRTTESWPNPVPDLYKGEPVVLSARMPKATGTLTLKGDVAGEPWEVRMQLNAGETRPGIGKLWARNKIGQLEADAQIAGDWEKHDAEILRVALDHNLVSRRTSLVAVDVTPSRPAGEKLASKDMPVNLPEGWDYEKVFGVRAMPAQKSAAFAPAAAPMLAMASAPAEADTSNTGLSLPQTSTDAPALIHSGALALLLAAVLAALWWLQGQWTTGGLMRRRR
ncbi:Vault protein inter-alpha-trypsin domain protein [Parvibaculum lavamentivorans DS-1]|uniref:Vault protein inter-alpha-trypsin domain protein n=1 Tax=Parvibaculum lavamentivorans (strain DS-1 / DSM 13023 / NCIMB 13966) TaxID=402881 RepID=A7HVH6_PARL1|nr:marine proteobacterial sortase target protein [Parvibaculum lavamentivorans]ABS63909.1 Vault protein inter-alpha-trypsin domain protein [Parvibaculum lavamentivorans DS-1]